MLDEPDLLEDLISALYQAMDQLGVGTDVMVASMVVVLAGVERHQDLTRSEIGSLIDAAAALYTDPERFPSPAGMN
jgi:hypothetical protein